MKPTLDGIMDDVSRVKSRISRAYHKGELTLEQMRVLIEQAETIDNKSKEYLGRGA